MRKPSKTAGELEASIKAEMEDICERPTDLRFGPRATWMVFITQDGPDIDPNRREMILSLKG